jgi:hypothetical protein
MPTLTPEELQEARRRKAEERRLEEERQQREAEEAEARELERERQWEARVAIEQELFRHHAQAESFASGVYDEVSKLSGKWPTHHVSSMMIERANRAIRTTKQLLADEPDEYLSELKELVPAGDPIQAQDVTLSLRMVKDALARMERRHRHAWSDYRMFG